MRLPLVILAFAVFSIATPVGAGPLLAANLSTTIFGATLDYDAPGAVSGNLDPDGSFTFDAGSGFAGPLEISTSVGAAGGAATITKVTLNFGANGAIAGNTGTTGSIGATGGGVPATGLFAGTALGAMDTQLARVDLSFGGNRTGAFPPQNVITFSGLFTLATLTLSEPEGDLWHLRTVTATGLVTGLPTLPTRLPMVSAMGGVSATPGGDTRVTLVTLAKTGVRMNTLLGVSQSITATPVFLTLTYSGSTAPEPAACGLLVAGLLGLALAQRRRA